MKDPLYKDSYFGITPPTFLPPFEAPDLGLLNECGAILFGRFSLRCIRRSLYLGHADDEHHYYR